MEGGAGVHLVHVFVHKAHNKKADWRTLGMGVGVGVGAGVPTRASVGVGAGAAPPHLAPGPDLDRGSRIRCIRIWERQVSRGVPLPGGQPCQHPGRRMMN